ncbi:hypothetical protein D3C78_1792180 [compost metagenome]
MLCCYGEAVADQSAVHSRAIEVYLHFIARHALQHLHDQRSIVEHRLKSLGFEGEDFPSDWFTVALVDQPDPVRRQAQISLRGDCDGEPASERNHSAGDNG